MTQKPPKSIPLRDTRHFLPHEESRRAYKPQGLGSLMPNLTRKVAGKRPTLLSDVQSSWEAIVGAELAHLTRPSRLNAKTLHLKVAAGAGPRLALRQQDILHRVGLYLGAGKVERLRLHQVEMFGGASPHSSLPPQESVSSDQDSLTTSSERSKDLCESRRLSTALEQLRKRLDES